MISTHLLKKQFSTWLIKKTPTIYAYWLQKTHPGKFNTEKLEGMDKGAPGK